jgi:hypothetical protein
VLNLRQVFFQKVVKFSLIHVKIITKMKLIKIALIPFLLPFFSHLATGQTVGLSLEKLKTAKNAVGTPPQYSTIFLQKMTLKKVDNQAISVKKPSLVPSIFSVEALPFFCKIEYKMGLNQKLPVKFRLGDVQYVEQLEGKR